MSPGRTPSTKALTAAARAARANLAFWPRRHYNAGMRSRQPTSTESPETAADLLRRCDFARLRPARAAALLEEALAKAPPKKEPVLVE